MKWEVVSWSGLEQTSYEENFRDNGEFEYGMSIKN